LISFSSLSWIIHLSKVCFTGQPLIFWMLTFDTFFILWLTIYPYYMFLHNVISYARGLRIVLFNADGQNDWFLMFFLSMNTIKPVGVRRLISSVFVAKNWHVAYVRVIWTQQKLPNSCDAGSEARHHGNSTIVIQSASSWRETDLACTRYQTNHSTFVGWSVSDRGSCCLRFSFSASA